MCGSHFSVMRLRNYVFKPLRDRVIGIFDLSCSNAGAGGSLYENQILLKIDWNAYRSIH